jgi:hypothetical protein
MSIGAAVYRHDGRLPGQLRPVELLDPDRTAS